MYCNYWIFFTQEISHPCRIVLSFIQIYINIDERFFLILHKWQRLDNTKINFTA